MSEETTCIADSRIPIQFDFTKMFCYEYEYVALSQCQSRTITGKCIKFKSVKDFKEEIKDKK